MVPVEQAFFYVLFGVVAVAVVAAVLSLRGERYDHIGRGGLFEDAHRPRPEPPPAVAAAERDEEVRQMLGARNARRRARGQPELDVDAELARLTGRGAGGPPGGPAADPALVAEVRQLVEARNRRRVRKGQEPLDVEAEVARQLRDLTG
jgi:hypothetical protein